MSDQNSRIRVNIHQYEEPYYNISYIGSYEPLSNSAYHFSQQVFNDVAHVNYIYTANDIFTTINDNINMIDIMSGLFGGDMFDEIGGGFNQMMEERILEEVQYESLQNYKTQEKKPHIKLAINNMFLGKDLAEKLKDEQCTVCKDVFDEKQNITQLECQHVLHTECISEWVKYKPECPVCRREVKTFDEKRKESKSSQESNENMSDDDLPELV